MNKFPYLFGTLAGFLFILAAVFKWNWLLNPNSSNFMASVYSMFGEMGVRILTCILGFIIIISCLILWIIKK